MKRFSRALAVVLAMGVATLVSAGGGAPPLKVNVKPTVKSITPTKCKVRLKVTVEVPGVAKNTFETSEVTVTKFKAPPPPPPPKFIGIFRITHRCQWKGDQIICTVSVEAGVLGKSLKVTKVSKAKVTSS